MNSASYQEAPDRESRGRCGGSPRLKQSYRASKSTKAHAAIGRGMVSTERMPVGATKPITGQAVQLKADKRTGYAVAANS